MPVYEYTCSACNRRFRKLVGMIAQPSGLACPRCGSESVTRLISRFARVRSEDDTLDALAEDVESVGGSDDPRAMRQLMKEMGKEMGEDLEQDFEQMMEEEESGSGGEDSAGDGIGEE